MMCGAFKLDIRDHNEAPKEKQNDVKNEHTNTGHGKKAACREQRHKAR